MRVFRLGAVSVERSYERQLEEKRFVAEDPMLCVGVICPPGMWCAGGICVGTPEKSPSAEPAPAVVVPASLVRAEAPPAEPEKEQAVPYTSGGLVGVITPAQAQARAGDMPWGLIGAGIALFIFSR